MEMILNEYDMVVGARFDNGTIQDYIDDAQTYGLVRIENTSCNWFLFNEIDSDDEIKRLYKRVKKDDHFIKDDFGEEIVLFNKNGDISYEEIIKKIDEYLDDEIMSSVY